VYGSLTTHPFFNYDDPQYVSENEHIQAGLSRSTLIWALSTADASNWHPLTWLSHALDCELFGLEPRGHHISSLVIHVMNVLLLFLLLLRLTGYIGRSAFVAALFALHPLNVESVAWIAERKNVLSTLFFLLTLIAYAWYVRHISWRRYIVVVVLFVMGLASKPMLVSLPFVLLLLDYWPLCRIQGLTAPSTAFAVPQTSWPNLIREKLPLFALSVGSAVVAILAQKAGHSVEPLGDLPIGWRVENALHSYTVYLEKLFFPVNLAVFYSHPLNTLTAGRTGLSVLFLLIVGVFVWKLRAHHGYALTGWLWFLGTLVPVIGIVQVGAQGMADRYMYIPAIGIFVITAWGSVDMFRALSLSSRYATVLALLILSGVSILTARQLGYWERPYDLWKHTLDVTQNNYVADDGIAYVLLHEGRPEALGYYEEAARIALRDPISHNAVAGDLQDHGKLSEAVEQYNVALRAGPEPKLSAHIYAELGLIYRQLGDDARAQQNSLLSLHADPQELPKMITQLSERVGERPAATGYFRLGLLLEAANRIAEAKDAYAQALQLNPQFNPARRALEALQSNDP